MSLFGWLFGKGGSAQGKTWKPGDRVLAKWHDSYFYPGRVQQVAGKTCQVYFDDGDVAWVHAEHMQLPDIVAGSRVFARIRGGPVYAAGAVSQHKGEKIHVRYDHGEEEWTTISMVRVQRPIADVGNEAIPPGAGPPLPVKQSIDLGEPVEGGDWRAGDRVLARWLDFFWYPGTLLAVGSKGMHVLFDDGDQRVAQRGAIMPLLVEEGESIFIRRKEEPQRIYMPAVVTRAEGERLDVEFEDGQIETNTRVSRARFWRCPVRVASFPFDEGDRVLAQDCDEFVYPAEIVSIQDDRIIVHFLDGPERMLTPELIRRFDIRVGAKVECRWKGAPAYFPGTLRQVDGERVFIHYDDGDQEWTSVRLLRFPGPVTVMQGRA